MTATSTADPRELREAVGDPGLVRDVVADYSERMLRTSGRRIDMSTSFVEAMMLDGSRLHMVIPVSTRTADTSARTHGRRPEPATAAARPTRAAA